MPSDSVISTGGLMPFLGRPYTDEPADDARFTPAERLRHRCEHEVRNQPVDLSEYDTDGRASTRLEQELRVIHTLGLDDFFLALHDLYQFARSRGHIALINGPAIGSVVAHRLGFSPVNPVRHRLPFERHLDAGRTFPPVQQLFVSGDGLDELAVGFRREYGFPEPEVSEPAFQTYSRDWHPPSGGKSGRAAIEVVEHPGLGVIARATQLVRDRHGADAIPDGLPENDTETMAVFRCGETDNVFGFGGCEIMEVLIRSTPGGIDDLAAVLAVTSSVAAGDALDEWLDGRSEAPQHPNADVEDVLHPTRGVLLYHEQVMELVHRVAGLDPVDGMRLVKLMWKRDAEGIAEFRHRFVTGARGREVEVIEADGVFDLIARRGTITVCKANALTTALVGYQIAWLKTHFPDEFKAAVGS